MKNSKTILPLAAFLSIGTTVVLAQSDADYATWMKTVGGTSGSLRKHLEGKSSEAASDAKKLEVIFEQVEEFWKARHAEDAVKFAANAREGYQKVAEEAAVSKFEEASATLKATSANCGGCHSAHREKAPDGSWKIK